MKPTRMQLFYAYDWPFKIWFTVVPLFFVLAAVDYCNPTVALFSDWLCLLSFLGIMVVSLLLGLFSSLLIGWPILGSLYYDRCLKNGGPFREGDMVRILVGPHKGKVVRVYSSWRGDTVRVELGEQEKENFNDIFSPAKLVRENEVEQKPSSPDPLK